MVNTSDPGNTQNEAQTFLAKLLEGLKVFMVVVLVLAGQGAVSAYNTTLDWSKINDAGMVLHLLTTAWNGFLAGLINGTARSIQVVMAIWAGPTVWKYAAPVVGASAELANKALRSFAALFKRSQSAQK